MVKPGPIQLSSDFAFTEVDIKLPCVNKYNTKDVRASGSWSVPDFDAADPLGLRGCYLFKNSKQLYYIR